MALITLWTRRRRRARPWRRRGSGRWRRRGSAWPGNDYSDIVHRHAGEVAEAILMHQELDADSLAYPRTKVHRLVNPTFSVASLMEDSLEDVTVSIRDVGILPGVIDAEAGVTVPVPEA